MTTSTSHVLSSTSLAPLFKCTMFFVLVCMFSSRIFRSLVSYTMKWRISTGLRREMQLTISLYKKTRWPITTQKQDPSPPRSLSSSPPASKFSISRSHIFSQILFLCLRWACAWVWGICSGSIRRILTLSSHVATDWERRMKSKHSPVSTSVNAYAMIHRGSVQVYKLCLALYRWL